MAGLARDCEYVMSGPTNGRGLAAVRRVRAAREKDSRIGLQQALATARQRETEVEQAHRRLQETPRFQSGTAEEFAVHMTLLRGLSGSLADRIQQLRTSSTVADEAQRRWRQDRQALRTSELLLERRAAERSAARARHEATALDELASQAWLRRVAAATLPGGGQR